MAYPEKGDIAVMMTIATLALLLIAFLSTGTFKTLTGQVVKSNPPVLIIAEVSDSTQQSGSDCSSIVQGKISNNGESDAEQITITCRPAIYPPTSGNIGKITGRTLISSLNKGTSYQFKVTIPRPCNEKPRFECTASCTNC